jgi:hypothetical protein
MAQRQLIRCRGDRVVEQVAQGRNLPLWPVAERYGIHRHAIAPGLRELEALGFIGITERGRAGNGEFRAPNKFQADLPPCRKRSADKRMEQIADHRGPPSG